MSVINKKAALSVRHEAYYCQSFEFDSDRIRRLKNIYIFKA